MLNKIILLLEKTIEAPDIGGEACGRGIFPIVLQRFVLQHSIAKPAFDVPWIEGVQVASHL